MSWVGTYILENGIPVKADTLTWGRWFEANSDARRIAEDYVGDVRISTVFLGLDHGFGSRTPILYETIVFGGAMDQEMERYPTREAAETGHRLMVERVKAAEEECADEPHEP